MSSRPQLNPQQIITNGDMSGSITSMVTIVQKLSMLSYQFTWAGTAPVGSIAVQVSNTFSYNEDGTVNSAGSWDTLPLSSAASVSGNTGHGYIDIPETGAFAMRVVYTRVSGTGSLQGFICGKVS